MKILVFMLCVVLLHTPVIAQEKNSEIFNVTGSETDLGVGEELKFDQNFVKFLKVISDSRCPRQVTCIWPGEAKVFLGIEFNGKYFEKEIVVSGMGAEFPLAENFLIKILSLEPYPETPNGITPEEYCLSFAAVLSKKD